MNRIHLCLAHMSPSGAEKKYVQEAFDTNWVVPLGPNVEGFESDLKAFLDAPREVVALSSGTAAVHLALRLLGVGPSDEVLVQSFTFCASSNPVRYLGATPVFIDSEPQSWNMDPDLLKSAIEDRISRTGRKPKAIIPVALYGMPYDVGRIMETAGSYGIPVIEDAAEGLGSKSGGRALGTFGKFGVLSFNGNKMITTSGGGALVCEDIQTRQAAMKLATQSREQFPYYQHEQIGYNYRMSNVCAGIGRGQMTVLREHVAHHRMLASFYREAFSSVPGIDFHSGPRGAVEGSNYWLSTVNLDPALRIRGQESVYESLAGEPHCRPNANVEALRIALDEAGIESRPLWKPMHLQPVYRDADAYLNPFNLYGETSPSVCEAVFKTGLCLPSGPCVSLEDARYVVDRITDAVR